MTEQTQCNSNLNNDEYLDTFDNGYLYKTEYLEEIFFKEIEKRLSQMIRLLGVIPVDYFVGFYFNEYDPVHVTAFKKLSRRTRAYRYPIRVHKIAGEPFFVQAVDLLEGGKLHNSVEVPFSRPYVDLLERIKSHIDPVVFYDTCTTIDIRMPFGSMKYNFLFKLFVENVTMEVRERYFAADNSTSNFAYADHIKDFLKLNGKYRFAKSEKRFYIRDSINFVTMQDKNIDKLCFVFENSLPKSMLDIVKFPEKSRNVKRQKQIKS